MEVNRRKRRRTDDLENVPGVSKKFSARSATKTGKEDEQYRRQMYTVSVRDALRKKSEARLIIYSTLQC
jgi:hypothetical protein